LALMIASLVAGQLFKQGVGMPFWFFVIGIGVCLVVGLLIYRSADTSRPPGTPRPTRASE
jgi:hypothetical protein